MVKPNARCAVLPLKLKTGLNVSLRIPTTSEDFQLSAPSVVLVALSKVVTEKSEQCEYQVCFTCLCEDDGRVLCVENYALECVLLVGYAFAGNSFWGCICVGYKDELYACLRGLGNTDACYNVVVCGHNGSTICYNDSGVQSVDKPFHDSSLIRRYRSRNGIQNHKMIPYRGLFGVKQIRMQGLAPLV